MWVNVPVGAGMAAGWIDPASEDPEEFDELIPRWLFAVKDQVAQATIALGGPGLTAIVLASLDAPEDAPLGPALAMVLIAIAATTSWVATAVAGGLLLLEYWWYGVAPVRSFAVDSDGDRVAVAAMALLVVGLVVLTRHIERTVRDVRKLDIDRRHQTRVEADLRRKARANRRAGRGGARVGQRVGDRPLGGGSRRDGAQRDGHSHEVHRRLDRDRRASAAARHRVEGFVARSDSRAREGRPVAQPVAGRRARRHSCVRRGPRRVRGRSTRPRWCSGCTRAGRGWCCPSARRTRSVCCRCTTSSRNRSRTSGCTSRLSANCWALARTGALRRASSSSSTASSNNPSRSATASRARCRPACCRRRCRAWAASFRGMAAARQPRPRRGRLLRPVRHRRRRLGRGARRRLRQRRRGGRGHVVDALRGPRRGARQPRPGERRPRRQPGAHE